MKHLGMYKGSKNNHVHSKNTFGNVPETMISGETHLRRMNGPTIGLDGIFSPALSVGSLLEIGTIIGYIYDIHGSKRETILSSLPRIPHRLDRS